MIDFWPSSLRRGGTWWNTGLHQCLCRCFVAVKVKNIWCNTAETCRLCLFYRALWMWRGILRDAALWGNILASCITSRAECPWDRARRLQCPSHGSSRTLKHTKTVSLSQPHQFALFTAELKQSEAFRCDLLHRDASSFTYYFKAKSFIRDTVHMHDFMAIYLLFLLISCFWISFRTEIFSGKTITHDDISYEQACILYNLGEREHKQFIAFSLSIYDF